MITIYSQLKLNIVVALSCEARTIIQGLKLKKDVTEHTFEIYHNQEKTICLIVSGVGKINSAIATTYLANYNFKTHQAFINIGIAAGLFEIGSLLLANKLHDPTIHKTFYPKINFSKKQPSTILETVDTYVEQYMEKKMIDMEAYGFYQAALKFTTQEFIQVFKIISDNSNQTRKKISSNYVDAIIQAKANELLTLINGMLEFLYKETPDLKEPQYFKQITNAFHFTQQQRQQVSRLLQKADIYLSNTEINLLIEKSTSSKELIRLLTKHLEGCY